MPFFIELAPLPCSIILNHFESFSTPCDLAYLAYLVSLALPQLRLKFQPESSTSASGAATPPRHAIEIRKYRSLPEKILKVAASQAQICCQSKQAPWPHTARHCESHLFDSVRSRKGMAWDGKGVKTFKKGCHENVIVLQDLGNV